MSAATIKFEMHKGRRSWVVGGAIRVYDEAEAHRLANDSDEPIEFGPYLVLVVDDRADERKLSFEEASK